MTRRAPSHVPVTMGSPEYRVTETPTVLVTHAVFPPNEVLPAHTHERAIFAVMCDGAFDTVIARRRLECTPSTAWTEPIAESHANYASAQGARVLVFQPAHRLPDVLEPIAGLLRDVTLRKNASFAIDARRVVSEMASADDVSILASDALFVTMLVHAERLSRGGGRRRGPPTWLVMVHDILHDRFRESLSLLELATLAGVHPAHLARQFRVHYRSTLGDYVRRLRCAWAADRLLRTDLPISAIAAEAGYADQSHLTRQCRRYLGINPGAYRRANRPG